MGLGSPWPLGTSTASWEPPGEAVPLPSAPWQFLRPGQKEVASGCRWDRNLAVEPLWRPDPPTAPAPVSLGQAPAGRAPRSVLNKKEWLVVEDESWRP